MSYAMPLFDRYPIEVEFDRRRNLWQRKVVSRYAGGDGDDLEAVIAEICGCEIITPIELAADALSVERTSAHTYEINLPYEGDDELWHLFPGNAPVVGLHGEIYRGDVINEICCDDAETARLRAAQWVDAIAAVLEHQERQIVAFEKSSATYLRTAFSKAKLRVGQQLSWPIT